jgi:putative membrane protein
MMWGGSWGWGVLGMLWMTLFWVVIVVLAVWAVTRFSERSGGRAGSQALDILEERFARGEIDR